MKRIAVIPGDGVGPEVVGESLRVLEFVAAQDPRVDLHFDSFPWGSEVAAQYPDVGTRRLLVDAAAMFAVRSAPLRCGGGVQPVRGHPHRPGRRLDGQANPIGSIWSTALMLDHLGHPEWGRRVMQAIEVTVAEPRTRTADLGGTATTSAAGAAVLEALRVAEVGSGNAQGHQGA